MDDDNIFRQGLYKFGKMIHAESLIRDGQVYVSNICDFRNPSRHTGLILDSREGQVTLVEDSARVEISIDDVLIYCATGDFISDSLQWAMSDKKECAVLIVDPDQFFGDVQNELQDVASLLGVSPCAYVGRDIDKQTSPEIHDQITANKYLAALVKPGEYAAQIEYRAVYRYTGQQPCPSNISRACKNLGRLIPVQFQGMEPLFSPGWVGWVGASLLDKAGVPMAWFSMLFPQQVLSTIFVESDGREYIGFVSRVRSMNGVKSVSRYTSMLLIRNVPIFAAAPIDEVGSIQYHLGDVPPENLRKRS